MSQCSNLPRKGLAFCIVQGGVGYKVHGDTDGSPPAQILNKVSLKLLAVDPVQDDAFFVLHW